MKRSIIRRYCGHIPALDGHFFTLINCKICNACLKKTKINEKVAGYGPFKTTTLPQNMELFRSRRWRQDRAKQKAVVFMLNLKQIMQNKHGIIPKLLKSSLPRGMKLDGVTIMSQLISSNAFSHELKDLDDWREIILTLSVPFQLT